MTVMDSLEREIIRYEKKDFKVEQKRTMKYGSRTFLKKKGGFLGTDECVYMYYVSREATTDSFREFFKDYEKFYKDNSFGDKKGKGLFLCSGSCDEKLFRDLRKAMIKKDNVRNSIKLISLGETTEEEENEEEEEVSTEKRREEKKTREPELKAIIEDIESFRPPRKPKAEPELDDMLCSWLSRPFPNIKLQQAYGSGKRIDAQIGNIGIEMKYELNSNESNRLVGQVGNYLDHLEKIVVVNAYEKTHGPIEDFEKSMKKQGLLNKRVFIVNIP
jgi:hypothetical protein